MGELRALTVRPPWAQAIAFGGKAVENRTWPTAYRSLVAIHAGRSIDWAASPAAWRAAGVGEYRRGMDRHPWRPLGSGTIIAVATLADCHDSVECMLPAASATRGATGCSPWAARGQWHWELADIQPLAEHVQCKGALGLWRLPEDAEKAVREQLEEAGRG